MHCAGGSIRRYKDYDAMYITNKHFAVRKDDKRIGSRKMPKDICDVCEFPKDKGHHTSYEVNGAGYHPFLLREENNEEKSYNFNCPIPKEYAKMFGETVKLYDETDGKEELLCEAKVINQDDGIITLSVPPPVANRIMKMLMPRDMEMSIGHIVEPEIHHE